MYIEIVFSTKCMWLMMVVWKMGCLFHEVWDTTAYTEYCTHIYSNRLADLPADDSRISPEMLVHSRPPQLANIFVVARPGMSGCARHTSGCSATTSPWRKSSWFSTTNFRRIRQAVASAFHTYNNCDTSFSESFLRPNSWT
jgi:hypothetical protein